MQASISVGSNPKNVLKKNGERGEDLFLLAVFLIFYWLFENFFILGKKAQNFSLKNEINFKKSKIPLDKSTKKW